MRRAGCALSGRADMAAQQSHRDTTGDSRWTYPSLLPLPTFLLTSPFLLFPFFLLGAFKLGLRRIVHLRRECDEMKRYIKEMKLAEHNIDATPSSLSPSSHLQSKQRAQRDFTVPGSNPVPHALSYEDLRRDRDHQLSSKRSVDSFTGLRKAKSDTDVALQSLRKKVEVRKLALLPPFSYHPSLFLLPFTCTSLPPSLPPSIPPTVSDSRQHKVER